jgi:uncharacterized protein (UPF0264 family)
VEELTALSARVRPAGLRFALAGGLDVATVPRLCAVPCDLFAVRTAACRGADRNGRVCAAAVRDFTAAIRECFCVRPGRARSAPE